MKSFLHKTGFTTLRLFISLLVIIPLDAFVQHFSIQYYTSKDGLPESNILQTYTDQSGYLWISTINGLSRFDGKNFRNFGLEHGLNNLAQRAMFEDSRHRFWIADPSAIGRLSGDHFDNFRFTDENEVRYINEITELPPYGLLALSNAGVYRYRNDKWELLPLIPGREKARVINMVNVHDTTYLNCRNFLAIIPPKGNIILTPYQEGQDLETHFNTLKVFHHRTFVSTFRELYEIRGMDRVPLFSSYLRNKRIWLYFMDSHKNMWINTKEDGLVIFRSTDETTPSMRVPIKINYHISNISEDREGNIWLSTPEGLAKITIEPFSIVNRAPDRGIDKVRHIQDMGRDQLLLSSTVNGLQLFDGHRTEDVKGDYDRVPGDLVDAWSREDSQTIWAATRYNHIYRIRGRVVSDYSHLMPAYNRAYTIDFDINPLTRKIFICTDSTLYYGDDKKTSVLIPTNTGKPLRMPAAFIVTRNGEQLLYLPDSGLKELTADYRLLNTGLTLDIPRTMTNMILAEDAAGQIWMVTGGSGLYVIGKNESGQWRVRQHYSSANGLSNDNLHSIAFNKQHQAWVVSSSGIDWIDNPLTGSGKVLGHFNEAHGLQSKNWSFGRLTASDAHTIWFSDPENLVRFDQQATRHPEIIPTVVVEDVQLNMTKTDWSAFTDSFTGYGRVPRDPQLRYDQNNIQISYQGIHFTNPGSLNYSYRLLPNDTNWSAPARFNNVSFLRLRPGTYTFQVRGRIGINPWSNQTGFSFRISRPFWETWWFRALILCMTTLLSLGAYRYRTRQVHQKAAIKTQLLDLEMVALKAQMNPHFIYNALNSIQSLVADNKRNDAIHYIGTFSRLLRQTLEQSDKNVVPLSRELETLQLYIQLESLRLNMELEFSSKLADDIIPEYEKIPPLTLQPFVENALWHGLSQKKGVKKLDIILSTQPGWILCEIADNGIGRDAARKNKAMQTETPESKGISLSVKRLAAFNEQTTDDVFAITDLYDEAHHPSGTKVTIRIRRNAPLAQP